MVTVFLANGFEEMEALAPIDLLRREGVKVQTAAVGTNPAMHGGKVVTGSHGVSVLCDIAAEEVCEEEMEMLVLPGGGLGTKNLNESPVVDRWLHYAAEKGIWIAAICAAPSVLGNKGLLDQKRAVAYPGFEPKGSIYAEGEFVVRDGNYITAKGAGVCLEFALELVSCLKGKATAEKVKDEIQCRK